MLILLLYNFKFYLDQHLSKCGPRTSSKYQAFPGKLLEMQILRLLPKPTELQTQGGGSNKIFILTSPPGASDTISSMKTTDQH